MGSSEPRRSSTLSRPLDRRLEQRAQRRARREILPVGTEVHARHRHLEEAALLRAASTRRTISSVGLLTDRPRVVGMMQ